MPVATTNRQSKRIRLVLLLVLACLAVVTTYQFFSRQPHYQVQVFATPTGWGYDIQNNGKPFIHQPTVPGQSGTVAFSSQEQARRVGEWVVQKLEQTEAMPALTNEELRQLGVKIP